MYRKYLITLSIPNSFWLLLLYYKISLNFHNLLSVSFFTETMMLQSMALNSLSSTSLVGVNNELHSSRFQVNSSTIRCCSRSHAYIPKLEPFSRTKFDRVFKDPPLIEKSENELAGISQIFFISSSLRFLCVYFLGFIIRHEFKIWSSWVLDYSWIF